jgi:hypothetical protein
MKNTFACITLTASFKSELALSVSITPNVAIWPSEEKTVLLTVMKLDSC